MLDARRASFADWVGHQGNYMTDLLLFDMKGAAPVRALTASARALYNRTFQFLPNRLMLQRELDRRAGASHQEQRAKRVEALLARVAASSSPLAVGLIEEAETSLAYLAQRTGLAWLPRMAASQRRVTHREACQQKTNGAACNEDEHAVRAAVYAAELESTPELLAALGEDIALYNRASEVLRAWKEQQGAQSSEGGHPSQAVAWPTEHMGAGLLPRIVHQSWKTVINASSEDAVFANLWRGFPGWEYRFWDDAANLALVQTHAPALVPWYVSQRGVAQADFCRLLYMKLYGGVYADLDVAPCGAAAVDSILGSRGELAIIYSPRGWASNFFMASAKGHPFWSYALSAYVQRANRSAHGTYGKAWEIQVMAMGPRFLDDTLKAYSRSRPCFENAVQRYSYDAFFQSVGVHAWAGTWHCGPGCSSKQRAGYEARASFSLSKASFGQHLKTRRNHSAPLVFCSAAQGGIDPRVSQELNNRMRAAKLTAQAPKAGARLRKRQRKRVDAASRQDEVIRNQFRHLLDLALESPIFLPLFWLFTCLCVRRHLCRRSSAPPGPVLMPSLP